MLEWDDTPTTHPQAAPAAAPRAPHPAVVASAVASPSPRLPSSRETAAGATGRENLDMGARRIQVDD